MNISGRINSNITALGLILLSATAFAQTGAAVPASASASTGFLGMKGFDPAGTIAAATKAAQQAAIPPLASTQPASVPVMAFEPATFTINGGKAPYAVKQTAGKPMALRQTGPNIFEFASAIIGEVTLEITDSAGTKLSHNTTFTAPRPLPPSVLKVALPNRMTTGMTMKFNVSGGAAPYKAVQLGALFAGLKQTGADSFELGSTQPGSIEMLITDNAGAAIRHNVIVSLPGSEAPTAVNSPVRLLLAMPSKVLPARPPLINLGYKIVGGTGPYTIAIPTIDPVGMQVKQINADTFSIMGSAPGAVALQLKDSAGHMTLFQLVFSKTQM